jgi:hypothetical protein
MAYTTIDLPTDYFNIKLYTGNATNPTTISGIGFQPDWVWTKLRAGGTEGHRFCDSVRGATKDLLSNTSSAESTNTIGLKSFNSDGYVIGNSNGYNFNSGTFVSWNWLAGGSASSNSDGSITSSVSANTTAGFSIVKYTGTGSNATIGHGLGKKPEMIIVKAYEDAQQWAVQHSALGATKGLRINTSAAAYTSSTRWNDTEPTSSVFSVGNEAEVNTNTEDHIAYCFTSIKGYSKFGSYTGNGNADGTFIYTGFKPAFVLIKQTNFGNSWRMYDNKRSTFNVVTKELYPNTSDSEATTDKMDFVSNGFKYRTSSTNANESGSPYIYMAFAESPFVSSKGIPTTAR